MIERDFNIPFIADLARREKQIQQNYRPLIAVHKWFARRPGTLFRGLLLAEFCEEPLTSAFHQSQNLNGKVVVDPFMGGGTPLLEANRVGCDVKGFDINPMSYWIVRQELEHLDLEAYRKGAESLRAFLQERVGSLYQTTCSLCGNSEAPVKYFLWAKSVPCTACGKNTALLPGCVIAENRRHPRYVFLCPTCGKLTETDSKNDPGACSGCEAPLQTAGNASRNQCHCLHCRAPNRYPHPESGPPEHTLIALEYFCPACRPYHKGRFFKSPDERDTENLETASRMGAQTSSRFVPQDTIPPGDETNRLHRWGYTRYGQLFNDRQRLGLELSCQFIKDHTEGRVQNALATNLSDLLRYQNMVCRYDRAALKSLDIFSVHGYPVGLIQCESTLLGIVDPVKRTSIGSGGWSNIIEKFTKAKAYCDAPFEIRHTPGRKVRVPMTREWIGDRKHDDPTVRPRTVDIRCTDASSQALDENSVDAVFTDPPYFGNVQYAELMDFCYVWLRKLLGTETPGFALESTRNASELTGNTSMKRDLEHFCDGLSLVFRRMAHALRPGAPLAFTYHHNRIEAYYPVAVALLDAELACSATIPCPAEMGASIHINGTGSSIIDTVLVSRSTGRVSRHTVPDSSEGLANLVEKDIMALREGNVAPTAGDIRCILHGHLARLAVWNLRGKWVPQAPTRERIAAVARWISDFGASLSVDQFLGVADGEMPLFSRPELQEATGKYGEPCEVSF